MRIVSGWSRGIRLVVPNDDAIRPTEDKVKESLFSTLGDMNGAAVLDLFSGTGALGLEALSRGASRVVMVERDSRHIAAIKTNLAAVLKAMRPHEPGSVEVLCRDARGLASVLKERFDFILADPPYHPPAGEYGPKELAADAALVANCAAPGTILALEHATDMRDIPWAPNSPWRLIKERSFGIRTVAYAKYDGQE